MDSTKFYAEMETSWSDEFINKRGKCAKRTLMLLKPYLISDNLKILDIGSDVGISTISFAKLLPNYEFIGIELGKNGVRKAKELKNKLNVDNVDFIVGDATMTNFDDDSFDIIICEQVIEHVRNQNGLIKEIFRILKKSGVLLISAPNKLFFWEPHINKPFIHWLPKRFLKLILNKKEQKYFTFLFPISTYKLEKMLKKEGFKPNFVSHRFFDKDIREFMFGKGIISFFFKSTRWLVKSLGKPVLKFFFPYTGFIAVKPK